MADLIVCPFCGEKNFDAYGLKTHLESKWCEPYEETDYTLMPWLSDRSETLAAAREEGRREGYLRGLQEAAEIVGRITTEWRLDAAGRELAAAIESRIASPSSGTAEREPSNGK